MPIPSRAATAAVIAALATSAKPVGDAIRPSDADDAAGYFIVYPIPGGGLGGPVGDPDADLDLIYQVSSVGSTRAQAQWLADKAADLLLAAGALTVAGAVVMRVTRAFNAGVERDDATGGPPLFYAAPRYVVSLTPA